jgi:hypothetical protein
LEHFFFKKYGQTNSRLPSTLTFHDEVDVLLVDTRPLLTESFSFTESPGALLSILFSSLSLFWLTIQSCGQKQWVLLTYIKKFEMEIFFQDWKIRSASE